MTRLEAHSKYHLTDDGHSTIDKKYDISEESICVKLYKQLLVEFKKEKEKNE